MKTIQVIFFCLAVFLNSCSEEHTEVVYSTEAVTTPQLFAEGVISTQNDEFDVCFTPDGKTLYFTRRKPDEKQKIYTTHFVNGEWTEPQMAAFSTDRDETPYITPDGKTLYFGSERPIPGRPNKGGFDMNIWKMNKKGDAWTTPEPLPESINDVQEEGENWPSSNANFFFTLDGRTHYFTTMKRGTKTIELYQTELENNAFLPPLKIEGLFENDSLWKYSACISPNSMYLVFNSYGAPEGKGGEDLYVSKRTSNGWSKAVNLGSLINSEGEESNGRFSPDGKYFFFTHADNLGNYEYGPWSIYFIETAYLNLDSLLE